MSTPKRHHFVPESYLRGFVEDDTGVLNVYDRRSDMWRRQKPKQVMVRNKYYYQHNAPDGVDKNILEKTLGISVEPEGLKALTKLIEMPETLDDEDTASILNYLQLQRIRVPRQADVAKAIAKTAITHEVSKTERGRDALKHGQIKIEDSFRFDFMHIVTGMLSPYLSRMTWELIEADQGSSFITSDSPVSFINAGVLPPADPGIGLYGTVVIYPINKRFLLLMRHPEYEVGDKGAMDVLPRGLDIEDGVIEIRKDILWSKEEVQMQNKIMLQTSQDLIVGESKEILEGAIGKILSGN